MAYRKFYKKPAEIENKAPASRKVIPWSDQQLTVFNACLNEKAVAVNACAGSGKTTTLVEAVWRILDKSPKAKILLLAFNNKIKAELQERLFGLPVSVHTVHSHGYAALREYWHHKAAKRNGKASWNIEGGAGPSQLKMTEAYIGYEPEKANDRQELCRLVSLCKAWMIFSQVKVKEIADKYQIIPQNVSEESFLNGAWEMLKLNHAAPAAGNTITFDDMVWIPASHDDCLVEKYDYVMVDEAQDLSLDRHSLVKKSLKPNGTIIVVGDIFQAIYSWSGADSDSLPNMIADYSASVYPLTVTRRCGKNIVERAQQFNQEIESANDAHDGEVTNIDITKLVETVSAGEAIVSRTNAPLLKLYFQLAKMRKQVCFIGRDFGGMMKGYLYGFKKGSGKKYFTALDAIETLENWFGAKEQAASLKNKEVSQFYIDLYETLKVVLDDLDNPIDSTDSFEEALSRCDNFVDTPNDKSIVLSSTHRAKGLEWGTVYMLTSTYKSENQEELNLNYVAITRAKNRLVLVEGKLK